MASKTHWERIYRTKDVAEVSWFQEHAAQSIELIKKTGVSLAAKIIDVGGGASTLVDDWALRAKIEPLFQTKIEPPQRLKFTPV